MRKERENASSNFCFWLVSSPPRRWRGGRRKGRGGQKEPDSRTQWKKSSIFETLVIFRENKIEIYFFAPFLAGLQAEEFWDFCLGGGGQSDNQGEKEEEEEEEEEEEDEPEL